MRNIEQALQEHKQVVLDAGYPEKQIFGVFLYGSQNYGLDTENSDVDTKAIIIPMIEDLCRNKAGFCKEYEVNGEKTVVMDIIHFFNNLKKQNLNYLETLYTEYFWVNPIYLPYWESLIYMREEISFYDKNRAIQSMGHQALHTLKQNSGDPKKFSKAYYLAHFLNVYMESHLYEKPFEAALKQQPHITKYIKDLKTGIKNYTVEDIFSLRKDLEKIIEKKFPDDLKKKEKIDVELFNLTTRLVRFIDLL